LNELAAALGDDANYAATTTSALGNRYTKAETDAKIVELAPATDISGKVNRRTGTQELDRGFGFFDDSGSAGDLNWSVGATDRGGVGGAGYNAFIISKRTDGVEFTEVEQGTEVFTMDDSGNLGLSNETPSERLDVNGNIKASGSVKLGDDTRTASAAGAGTLRWNTGKLQNSVGGEWRDVSDLSWGSIQWDHNTNVGLTNTGFSLRPSGSNGWTKGVYLLTPFNGDVLVEFTAERHSDPHHGMLGFSTNVPTSVTYTEAEYRWYADHGTTSLHGQSTQYNTSYGPSDVFKMERVGGTLKWYFNDTEVHGVNYSGPLYLHAGLYTNNQSIHITKIIGVLG